METDEMAHHFRPLWPLHKTDSVHRLRQNSVTNNCGSSQPKHLAR